MYYCEGCRIEANWPDSFCKSEGTCEICNKHAICWDRPSRSLPPWPDKPPEPVTKENYKSP